jgi:hypothetical protein
MGNAESKPTGRCAGRRTFEKGEARVQLSDNGLGRVGLRRRNEQSYLWGLRADEGVGDEESKTKTERRAGSYSTIHTYTPHLWIWAC